MSYYSINGIERDLPISTDRTFFELLQHIRNTIVSEQNLISSIIVNGEEVTILQEEEIASTPISELKSIEVLTAHPKEIADETLQHLLKFTKILENLSLNLSTQNGSIDFINGFVRLIDGLSTLTETITGVKKLLKVPSLTTVDTLETDMLFLLKTLLNDQEHKNQESILDILKTRLPEHLNLWITQGIPALIRARDS